MPRPAGLCYRDWAQASNLQARPGLVNLKIEIIRAPIINTKCPIPGFEMRYLN